jgi:hypothetical protein
MSVIITLQMKGDASALEQYASEHPDAMTGIVEQAKGHGLMAHRFYGDDNGHLMIVDEWPDFGSFQTFFSEAEGEIGPLMGAAGVADRPEITSWRKLETGDSYGWED